MGLTVDSSVFISAERKRGSIDLSPWHSAGPVVLSVITVSELLAGVHRANTQERRDRRAVFVEAILQSIPVMPIDAHIARFHAALFSDLVAHGRMIGAHDLWIAATAMAGHHSVLFCTRSEVRHFRCS